MGAHQWVAHCLLMVLMVVGAHQQRPVIGILTCPLAHTDCITLVDASDSSHTSCFHILYANWVEQAGIQVVPVPFDSPRAELDRLFTSLNGLLITGGEYSIWETNSSYMQTARSGISFAPLQQCPQPCSIDVRLVCGLFRHVSGFETRGIEICGC